MKAVAAFTGTPVPEIVDVPEPKDPGPREVRCRTLELGICGTDREILRAAHPAIPPGEKFLVLGHEALARVEAVGSEVSEFSVGDHVVPTVRRSRPDNPLRVDMQSLGTYWERGIVELHGFSAPLWNEQPEYLLKVTDSVRPYAVLAEPFSVTEKAVHEALILQHARFDEAMWTEIPPRVLVTGMGPIGFAGLLSGLIRGWPTTMVGRDGEDSSRVAAARRLGAKYLHLDQLDSDPKDVDATGYDLIIETTGNDTVMVRTARVLASRSIMVWLASAGEPAEDYKFDLQRLMLDGFLRNQIFLGCVNSAPRDFASALHYLDAWRERDAEGLEAVITDRVPLEESLWHFQNRRPGGIKTVVTYK